MILAQKLEDTNKKVMHKKFANSIDAQEKFHNIKIERIDKYEKVKRHEKIQDHLRLIKFEEIKERMQKIEEMKKQKEFIKGCKSTAYTDFKSKKQGMLDQLQILLYKGKLK